jgi:hypothetical protein
MYQISEHLSNLMIIFLSFRSSNSIICKKERLITLVYYPPNLLSTYGIFLISVGYHMELEVARTFYQHYQFLPTKLHHFYQCAY